MLKISLNQGDMEGERKKSVTIYCRIIREKNDGKENGERRGASNKSQIAIFQFCAKYVRVF